MIVAIDGPCGSGKGTVAKLLSERLNLVNIDTGATYRCLALKVLRNNIDLSEEDKIIDLSRDLDVKFSNGRVFLDGEDVSLLIRNKDVSSIVSPISSIVRVRSNLVSLQREMANHNDVVLEGRDITTVVFPNAEYKFYLDASLDERVARRVRQNKDLGIDMSVDEVSKNISDRDFNDMNKPVGALKRTDEQIYIDSTNMSIDEVVDKMVSIINK